MSTRPLPDWRGCRERGPAKEASRARGLGWALQTWSIVIHELRGHAPYTLLGTAGGVLLMIALHAGGASPRLCETLFWTAHPFHVLVSGLVTAAIYRLRGRGSWPLAILVGYLGSVGIATLSDCVIPYLGECLLGAPHRGLHIGFVEKWWLVNPLALAGCLLACRFPWTRIPHAIHVWLSTWASLFHMTMAAASELTWPMILVTAAFLFLAVWVPCCTSDIVFPLLFPRQQGDRKRVPLG